VTALSTLYDPSLLGTPGYANGTIQGEQSIYNWMHGGQMDPGLKAASVNEAFHLNNLGGSQINNYLGGGGSGNVPASPQDYGWKWQNNQWVAPQGDTSGITWDPASQQFKTGQNFNINNVGNPGAPALNSGGAPGATGGTNADGTAMTNAQGSGQAVWPTFGQNDQYKFSPSGQYNDPSYQFRLDEGMRGLMSQKAALGDLGTGQSLRDIMNYGQNAASQEYGNAYNRFQQDRQFNYGVNQDDINRAMSQANIDRNFDYTAQTGDRAYNLQQLGLMGQLGLGGLQGQGSLQSALAALLSGNLNTMGQIQGSGTIGGANAQNGGLQQIISFLMQNSMMNRIPGLNPA
jgi:hypothetical protein